MEDTWKVLGLSMKRRHRISRFRLTLRSAEIYEYVSKRYILLKLLL